MLIEPGQVALEAIALVARQAEPVELPRVDHELRFDALAFKGLIHLLAADDRNVEVLLPAQEQRRRLDPVGLEEGG